MYSVIYILLSTMPKITYYPWQNRVLQDVLPIDIPTEFMDMNSVADKIEGLLKDIRFSFENIMDDKWVKFTSLISAIFSATELSSETEHRVRELLKDHHSTFTVFEKWMSIACEKASRWEKVSVDLYIKDVGNPNFIETLRRAKMQGINPKLLILEMRADDYGIVDSTVIMNLKEISSLWFDFSLNDFVIEGNEVKTNHLEKVVKERLLPSYVKIAKNVYEKMRNWAVKMENNLRNMLGSIVKQWVSILIGNNSTTSVDVTDEFDYTKQPDFFRKATIVKEGILWFDGTVHARESLIRFWDGVTVPQGLQKLKELWMTNVLMHKVIVDSIEDLLNGKRSTINVYIKNIWDPNFREEIKDIMGLIPISYRKNLIFEILEEKYGVINNQVIDNIRFLQSSGFSIAIDDLYVWENPKWMSKEILEVLIECGIHPDYIKIDGRHIEAIREWTLSYSQMAHLREVIGYFSLLQDKPIFIAEWIQDTEHAIKVMEMIWMYGVEFLFQGRNIREWNFGYGDK